MAAEATSAPPPPTTGYGHLADQASFVGHVFDVPREKLLRGATLVKLSPKALLLLKYFLHHPGRVVSKDDLMAAIWGTTVVTENSLVQLVVELRNALGDKEHHIVETVPRRGYLFAAPLEWRGTVSLHPPEPRRSRRRHLLASIAALACVSSTLTAPKPTPNVDDEYLTTFPVLVAPLVEGDVNGLPSQTGRRIADDVTAWLVKFKMRPASPEDGARLAISGRLLRHAPNGIAVDLQMRDLASGTSYSLLQASFPTEEALVRSDLALRVVRVMIDRRNEIILARAQEPGHQPDALELLHLAWNDYNLASNAADLARASARFEAVLQKDPSSVSAGTGRSFACLRTFSHLFSPAPRATLTECERQVHEVYARAPENTDVMQAMAMLLYNLGKPEEAVWLLRKALDLCPADRTTSQLMAMVLIKNGRFDEAVPYLEFTRAMGERRREHGPSDRRRQAFFYQVFADKAVLQGHDDESREWLLRWTAEFPDDGRPYLILAAIDALHGRDEQAKTHMARHRLLLPRSNLRYVAMLYPTSNPTVIAERDRLLEGMRLAGLPEGG
jgi:DNA-binding winged helix-turn-helix (wHTH) protein/tetratricopeptide (TPR) repeat protein